MQLQAVIYRRTQLPGLVGLSLATIDRLRRTGDFPAPVRLGVQAVGFRKADIDTWLATREAIKH